MAIRTSRILFFILLFLSIYSYSQESILDQKITMVKENVTVGEILTTLEEKFEFTTGYSSNSIDLSKKTSINANDQTVNQVLRILFPSKLYRFKILGKKLLIYKRQQRYVINGYVSESVSQEYLGNVSVYVLEQGSGSISNDYGFYSLSIPEGKHKVLFSFIGYKSVIQEIDLQEDLNLNIALEPETEFLEEIVINSDRETLKSQVTQMSNDRISPGIIEETPAILGEKDALKTLQLLPGVQASNEGAAGFYVRGGSPDQNLIILDESIVYNSNHLFGIFSIFNGDAIKTVEMFKGGFPARYGGRLSSVVKIDTKNGNKEKIKGNVNISLISSSFLLEGPLKKNKTSFVLSGRRTYLDLLLFPLFSDRDSAGYNFSDINAKIHHVFNDKNKLYWSFYFGEDKTKNERVFSTGFEGNTKIENFESGRIQWGNITSTLRWNHEFNNKLFSNTSLIFSNYKFTSETLNIFGDVRAFDGSKSGIDDYGVKLDFNYYPSPIHTLKFGIASTYHDFTPKAISVQNAGNIDITSTQKIKTLESAIYIEDDWKISDKLGFYPGLRFSYFQHKSKAYVKPEIRFSMAYKLKPSLAIKASYAKMNQFIHRLSNTGIGLPTDLWISSTDRLKPQLSEQIALGIARDFGDDMYEATIEAYYKKMDDIIELKEGSSISRLTALEDITNNIQRVDFVNGITTGKGWAYGSEFLLRKKRGKFSGWLGYTLSWSQRQFANLNQGKKFNDRYDQRHDVSLVATYKFDRPRKPHKKITLSANWVFSSGINFNFPNTIGLDPNIDFPITGDVVPTNPASIFNDQRNNFKGENFHRLVLGVQFHKKTKRNRDRRWGWSFYNLYNRKNPFYYAIEPSFFNVQSERRLVKGVLFQFIPSFNYNLKF